MTSGRKRRLIAFAVLFATVALTASPVQAHNKYRGAYRKWPWAADRSRTLTTLPGQCPHCPGVQSSSAWKAIDANLNYETVTATSPGRIDAWVTSGGAAGKYLRILDDDGTYITYEHLSEAIVTSGRVVAGQPIAKSGCTGNCSGPHLHFQRHDAPSFNSNALSLEPISSHGWKIDTLQKMAYLSDNAGIGTNASGQVSSAMRAKYRNAGGHSFGVTANLGDYWSPCRNDDILGTWWRYWCAPRSGWGGGVQTFLGPGENQRALLQKSGSPNVYTMYRAMLGAYTSTYKGQDWIYWIGWPTSDRYWLTSYAMQQDFEHGTIRFWPDKCIQDVFYRGDSVRVRHYFCD